MLAVLRDAERELPKLLTEKGIWKGVYIDYHKPFVERLWCQWGEYRIYLHRILACGPGEALFHPHPWPSAMKVFGDYEMKMGFSAGNATHPEFTTIILGHGNVYEMTHQDGWHSVRPLAKPSFSLMVTGQPWQRWSPAPSKQLRDLKPEEERRLFRFFRTQYPTKKQKKARADRSILGGLELDSRWG